MNMHKVGASRKPGTLASKSSDDQKFPRHFQIKMQWGKRSLASDLRAVCATIWGKRVLVCVQVLESAQVL